MLAALDTRFRGGDDKEMMGIICLIGTTRLGRAAVARHARRPRHQVANCSLKTRSSLGLCRHLLCLRRLEGLRANIAGSVDLSALVRSSQGREMRLVS